MTPRWPRRRRDILTPVCAAIPPIVQIVASPAGAAFVPGPHLELPGGDYSSGASIVDIDGDGNADVITYDPQIGLGLGDGTFVEGQPCEAGGSPIVADFDNDGHRDILRVRDDVAICYGDGEGGFRVESMPSTPHLGAHSQGWQIAYSGVGADLNGDGWLDAYLTSYEDQVGGGFVYFADVVYGNDAAGALLLLGTVPPVRAGRGVAAADFDDDNDRDIYVSNYRLQPNLLWRNDGQGGLRDDSDATGAAGAFAHTISSPVGDLDGDGDIDIVVGNFSHPGQPQVDIMLNDLSGSGRFESMGPRGIEWQESFASFALGDYDNDGDLDLFIATVYPGDWGRLYRNDGTGFFEDVTDAEGLSGQKEGYGLALGDVDNDGTLDVILGGTQEQHLFLGTPNGNHWLEARLVGDGERVNASAVGARLTVRLPDRTVVREVQAGGTGGDRGTSDLTVHMGLGSHEGPLELEVRWPWAETCTYEVEPDAILEIPYDPDCGLEGEGESGSSGSETSSGDDASGSSGDDPAPGSDATSGGSPANDDPARAQPSACACTHRPQAGAWGLLAVLFVGAWRPRRVTPAS